MRPLEMLLRDGLAELGLALSDAQVGLLLDYLALLQKWNGVYNLTAVREPREMLTHHLLDSLAALGPLRRHLACAGLRAQDTTAARGGAGWTTTQLLDVGSGAGLPGVVFAIGCPELDVTCVDAVAKKTAFVRQASAVLGLPKLHGLHARVEALTRRYNVVCSRAFASLADFTAKSGAALVERGVWLAMKGRHPAEEIAALPPGVEAFHVERLQPPGLGAERCIVWLRKAAGGGAVEPKVETGAPRRGLVAQPVASRSA